MDPNTRLPLFAFGTLRRGRENHHYLAGRYDRVLEARLDGYAIVWPLMIDRRPGNSVPGELFVLPPATCAATLADCDDLEGIPPGTTVGEAYERRAVVVQTAEGRVIAWAYTHPQGKGSFARER